MPFRTTFGCMLTDAARHSIELCAPSMSNLTHNCARAIACTSVGSGSRPPSWLSSMHAGGPPEFLRHSISMQLVTSHVSCSWASDKTPTGDPEFLFDFFKISLMLLLLTSTRSTNLSMTSRSSNVSCGDSSPSLLLSAASTAASK